MSSSLDNESALHQENAAKGTEVFIGGLARSVTEDKIREVFSTCGEIAEVRLIKDQKGNSKGYCFLRFLTREAAVKALKDKAGIMLEGRKIGVLPSTEQTSLFLGNLPKEWNIDEFEGVVRQVFQDVVSVKIVQLSKKQRNRGFGFVYFSSHAAAARAYRMGTRSDFVLGGVCHPTVEWAEEKPEVDVEELAEVKVALVSNLPTDVNEDFINKIFGPHGEIEKVVLPKKGQSQVAYVHFAKRSDLDNAVEEMNDKTVQGPNGSSFKLQVEVARPMRKSKKRACEDLSKTRSATNSGSQSKVEVARPMRKSKRAREDLSKTRSAAKSGSQSKVLKVEAAPASSRGHVLKVLEESVVCDPYEAAVFSLPVAVQDRLLRILRLGIATRYDIDIQCLRSLKGIPESAAISVLDQFLLSGADAIDKGAFLAGLIMKVRNQGSSRIPEFTSRASDSVSVRSDFIRISGRSQLPVVDSLSSPMATTLSRVSGRSQVAVVDSFPSPVATTLSRASGRSQLPVVDSFSSPAATTLSRYDSYSPRFSYLDHSLSPRAGITRTVEERNPFPLHSSSSSARYERTRADSPIRAGRLVDSHIATSASYQSARTQVRFDPFTGEPYKFDPFTGEPIQPGSLSRTSGSLYR